MRSYLPMCNLYKTRKSVDEIARLFDALASDRSVNVADELFPGMPGLVVRPTDGARVVQSMVWGWPLVTRDMRERAKATGKEPRPKPVNNARDLSSSFWKAAVANPDRRCLIPVGEFAEAEGEKGAKTRTWFSVKDAELFAWAGLWRPSIEWGDVYSGVMTEANALVAPTHDRMPVILAPEDHERWLTGNYEDVLAMQKPFPPERMEMRRTDKRWVRG